MLPSWSETPGLQQFSTSDSIVAGTTAMYYHATFLQKPYSRPGKGRHPQHKYMKLLHSVTDMHIKGMPVTYQTTYLKARKKMATSQNN